MKKKVIFSVFRWMGVLGISVVLHTPLAYALPEGGSVVGGQVDIQTAGSTMDIHQTTDQALIHWNQFDIASAEAVRFSQPGNTSVALNRVTGINPSSILGRLTANGQVFLINPNGILFGREAVVDVAGLLATTFNMSDSDFMAGENVFYHGSDASIVNYGTIKASDNGFVMLVAPGVTNEGLIMARLGKVFMGSGEKLTVDFLGDGLLQYAIDGKTLEEGGVIHESGLPAAVSNKGTILSDGGEVVLSAQGTSAVFRQVVNQEGVIRANSLVNRGGIIRLMASAPVENSGKIGRDANLGRVVNAMGDVRHTGILDVSAAEGEVGAASGSVTLSGARIDLSGSIEAPGGNVLVTSTERTIVSSSGRINTSGVGNQNAGNGVVWSDGTTVFEGTILARGGGLGGDAGDAEISGYQNLEFSGSVDLTAPLGKRGTVLLDPPDLTVKESDLQNINADIVLMATNKITLDNIPDDVALLAPNVSLTLHTDTGDITFASRSDAIIASGTGAITIEGGGAVSVGKLETQNGAIRVTANKDVDAKSIKTSNTVTLISQTGALIDSGSGGAFLEADTANLTAAKDIGSPSRDYDVQVNHLILDVKGSFNVTNHGTLKTLQITSAQAGAVNTYALKEGSTTFKVTDTGDSYHIENVLISGVDFTFSGDEKIVVDNLSAKTVSLTSRSGSIEPGALTGGKVLADAITLASPSGSIGVAGGSPLTVDSLNPTLHLTLNAGMDINVRSLKDLDLLSLSVTSAGTVPKTYALTASGLTFNVQDKGAHFLLAAITDSTGLDFTFQGNKEIQVGSINVVPTSGTPAVTPAVTLISTASSINDEKNDASVDIVATRATLTAAGGIGVANGDLDLNVDTLSASATNKDIALSELNDLAIDRIDAGTGNVTLVVGGAISDDKDDAEADIKASQARLTAKTGIGAANGTLDIDAATITAKTDTGGIRIQGLRPATFQDIKTTGSGNILLIGTGATTFRRIQTDDGNISLSTDKGTLRANTITAGKNGDIALTTTTSGDILIECCVVAEGNKITTQAAGSVFDADHPGLRTPPAPGLHEAQAGATDLGRGDRSLDITPILGEDRVIEISMIPPKAAKEVLPRADLSRPMDENLSTPEEQPGAPSNVIDRGESLLEAPAEDESPSVSVEIEEGLDLGKPAPAPSNRLDEREGGGARGVTEEALPSTEENAPDVKPCGAGEIRVGRECAKK